jgi:SAM-dependent methyltransferase
MSVPAELSPSVPIEAVRRFWEDHPVADAAIGPVLTPYDYFRAFDNLREAADVEPYEFSNRIHGYESSAGLRVLDYGCGNGYVLSHYAKNGALVCGVDLTEAALRRARARFDLMGLPGSFAKGDGVSIPFRSGTFDIACSMGVLHHVSDPRPILNELHRVLRPGGRLMLMVYNRDSFRYRVTFRWRKLFGAPQFRGKSIQQIANMNDGPECPLAVAYTVPEVRALLGDFADQRYVVNKLGTSEIALFSPALKSLLDRILPGRLVSAVARRVGWNLYVTAIRPPASA